MNKKEVNEVSVLNVLYIQKVSNLLDFLRSRDVCKADFEHVIDFACQLLILLMTR